MIELDKKSPINIIEHKKCMEGAHRVDADVLAHRIKSVNPKLYMEMRLGFYQTKKMKLDPRTGLMKQSNQMSLVEAWKSPTHYIVKVAGVTYYLTYTDQ